MKKSPAVDRRIDPLFHPHEELPPEKATLLTLERHRRQIPPSAGLLDARQNSPQILLAHAANVRGGLA